MSSPDYAFESVEGIKNWIGGSWVDSTTGRTMNVINPRHGKVMTTVADGGADDVAAAIAAAKEAFPAWSATPVKERAAVLYRVRELMMARMDELAKAVSHENGKTLAEAKAEVAKGIECVEFGCSLPNLSQGGVTYVSRGVTCEIHHEPMGVVAGVVPFNFPFMVPLWMLPQALVSGNTFVLKPSEKVPVSAWHLATLFKEAGLPDGVLNIVNGGKEVVEALTDHQDVRALAFVGSTRVAKLVYARGAQTGRRMLCLGGAKNHLIVVPDADVEMTSHDVVRSFTGCAGQRCMAASAMLAVGNVDNIIETIVEKASTLTVGEDMGCIIDEGSVQRIERTITQAQEQGAKVLLDGRGTSVEGAPGYWMGPTILEVTTSMPAYTDEIFGPVLSIVRVKTLDEALRIENSHEYANGGSIYTTSGATARYAAQRINAGMTGVNIGVPVPREPYSFGGWEHSKFGHGDITGEDGFNFWTRRRKITTKWALQPDETWMS
ncbi:MAG: CoA-acylating methylmalonate-semialdehyde dehydrogenase [Myxococcota bacterium]